LREGRDWAARMFRELVAYLAPMAKAPTDEIFFAVLAALLTAHDGLAWNRIFIFACRGRNPIDAELVYALGGRGEEMRAFVQQEAERIQLADLVATRFGDPVPKGFNRHEGRDCTDSLYELCIKAPRNAGEPIVIPFGDGSRDKAFEDYLTARGISGQSPNQLHPLQFMLEQDYSLAMPAVPKRLHSATWFDYMNDMYPGIFCDTEMYAFPLWKIHEEEEKPLGLIVVEMHEHLLRPLEQTISATTMFLELVSSILASRYHERFVRGWIGGLPAFRHHLGLGGTWAPFVHSLNELLSEVDEGGIIHSNIRTRLNSLVALIKTDRDDLQKEVDQVVRAQRAMEWESQERIEDLNNFLDVFAAKWEHSGKMRVRRDWCPETIRGMPLSCPPDTLEETLGSLVDNAYTASRLAQGSPLEIRINVHIEETLTTNFGKVIAIEVSDTGPGIPTDVAQHIFMDGFSAHSNEIGNTKSIHKGRGLSVARAQLLMYRGDLQLVHPGPRPDPSNPSDQIGATFVVRFGIRGREYDREYISRLTKGGCQNGEVISRRRR